MRRNSKLSIRLKHSITSLDENELIKRCINEDRVAQHALFNQYASNMISICFRYAQHKEEAEDMVQEGFILVFNNLHKFRFQSSLKTWITRIMINTAINYLRKHHKLKWDNNLDPVSDHITHSSEQLHMYDAQVVMECLQELPVGYRMVLNLYAIEGFSHKEIADQLGIEEGTSRSQYAKAKMRLQHILQKKGVVYHANEAR